MLHRWRTSWRFSPQHCFLSPCWGRGWASTSGSRCSSSWPESLWCRYQQTLKLHGTWAVSVGWMWHYSLNKRVIFLWHIWSPFACGHLCFNLDSGPQSLKVTPSRRSCLQAPSLWDWWLCWWPVCPVASLEFTLRKSSRRLNRVCGSETYSWVSNYGLCLFGMMTGYMCILVCVWVR